ncbi:TPA: hypothetical protein ACI4FD_005141, partial [Klebsiella aerogenes]
RKKKRPAVLSHRRTPLSRELQTAVGPLSQIVDSLKFSNAKRMPICVIARQTLFYRSPRQLLHHRQAMPAR